MVYQGWVGSGGGFQGSVHTVPSYIAQQRTRYLRWEPTIGVPLVGSYLSSLVAYQGVYLRWEPIRTHLRSIYLMRTHLRSIQPTQLPRGVVHSKIQRYPLVLQGGSTLVGQVRIFLYLYLLLRITFNYTLPPLVGQQYLSFIFIKRNTYTTRVPPLVGS